MNRRHLMLSVVGAAAGAATMKLEASTDLHLKSSTRWFLPDGTQLRYMRHPYSNGEVPGCDHVMCPCHDVCWRCGTTRQALEELTPQAHLSEASLEKMLIDVQRTVVDRGLRIKLRPTKFYPMI